MSVPAVLVIGGLDSSGGAGVGRDARAVRRAGGVPRLAVTAVTAQTDQAVLDVHLLPLSSLRAQILAAFAQGPVRAVKIGMLGDAARAALVAATVPEGLPWVLDPVLASSSGASLLDDGGRQVLRQVLLPRSTLVTPNLPELACLAADARGAAEEAPVAMQVSSLLESCAAVLVKGGHAGPAGPCSDQLYRRGRPVLAFPGPRHGFSLRGTGCELASTIAAGLARGLALEGAVAAARACLAARFAVHAGRAGAGAVIRESAKPAATP